MTAGAMIFGAAGRSRAWLKKAPSAAFGAPAPVAVLVKRASSEGKIAFPKA